MTDRRPPDILQHLRRIEKNGNLRSVSQETARRLRRINAVGAPVDRRVRPHVAEAKGR